MVSVQVEFLEIPHGHGLSCKKGVADGLLECRIYENDAPSTHSASYERGIVVGMAMKEEISRHVKV
ncbi:MAG: hypothetical protein Q8L73_06120 [Methylotenera sp.]|nr:hypothetical protein [Methylotenera sp.]